LNKFAYASSLFFFDHCSRYNKIFDFLMQFFVVQFEFAYFHANATGVVAVEKIIPRNVLQNLFLPEEFLYHHTETLNIDQIIFEVGVADGELDNFVLTFK